MRKTLFSKIIATIVSIGFVLTSVPASYAQLDMLRPQAAKNNNPLTSKLAQDLISGRILILSNNISLHRGAQTGGYNISHATSDGAQGGIFNHSERRLRIETAMMNMLRSIRSIDKKSKEKIEAIWKNALKTENLSDADIAATLGWLDDFQAKSRDEQTIELLGRRLTNYVINLQLKEVIAYSNKTPISQTVLCVGETHQQYLAKRTTEVLESDLEEMLDGISAQDAQKIGLRIAYEPRWAIGTGLTPTVDEIQSVHQFIKRTTDFILGTELDVDYGGSLNKGNAERILALADVDGGLIGGAAKKPADILPVIEEAIEQGKIKNKILNVGMNWKAETEATGLAPITDFVELFLRQDLTGVRIVISTPQVATVRRALARSIRRIAGASGEATITFSVPLLLSFGKADLEGKRVLVRVDWNVPDLEHVGRIIASIPGLAHIIQNGGTPIVLSHYGRPGGRVNSDLSLGRLTPILERLLKEQGYDTKVVFHEGSITADGVAPGVKDKIVTGAINVIENTRFCTGDERNNPDFAQALAALAGEDGIFVFDGFGAGERVHASTAGAAEYMSRVALGPLVVQEESAIRGALRNLYGLIFGGGPKVGEKMGAILNAINNMQEGGFIIIGSGPAPAFLALEGITVGQRPTDEDIGFARQIVALAREKNVRLILPIDFYGIKQAITDTRAWRRDNRDNIPTTPTVIYHVTLAELRQGTFAGSATAVAVVGGSITDQALVGDQLSADSLFLYDVGPESRALFAEVIAGVGKNRAVVWNGSLGINEIDLFEDGTRDIAMDLAKATQNGVTTVVVGGDTAAAAEQFDVADRVSDVSTGGGAALGLLEGRELQAVEKLAEAQSTINTASALKVDLAKLRSFIRADETIYAALAGGAFGEYVKSLQGSMSATQAQPTQALVIGPGFFKLGGVKNALSQVAQLSSAVKIGLYGEDAEKLKILLGNQEIITAKTPDELIPELTKLGIEPTNIVLLRSPDDATTTLEDVRQIVATQISTVAISKALYTLLGNDAAFGKFYEEVKNVGVISEQAYNETREALLAKLEEGIFALPEAVKVSDDVSSQTEEARKATEEFMGEI